MSGLRSFGVVLAILWVAADVARLAPGATWGWFQAKRILAIDAARQRQFDILDRELAMMRGITSVPTPAPTEPASLLAADFGR